MIEHIIISCKLNVRLQLQLHFLELLFGHVALAFAESLKFLTGCIEIGPRWTGRDLKSEIFQLSIIAYVVILFQLSKGNFSLLPPIITVDLTTYNVTTIIIVLLNSVMKPDKLFVLPDNAKVCLGETR